jgi:type II secretory pathway component HofQ
MKVREQKEMMVKRSLDTEATLAKSATVRPLPTASSTTTTSFWVAPSAAEVEKKHKEEQEKEAQAQAEREAKNKQKAIDYHTLYVQQSLLSEQALDQLFAQKL